MCVYLLAACRVGVRRGRRLIPLKQDKDVWELLCNEELEADLEEEGAPLTIALTHASSLSSSCYSQSPFHRLLFLW